jgi:hypothetical protein
MIKLDKLLIQINEKYYSQEKRIILKRKAIFKMKLKI